MAPLAVQKCHLFVRRLILPPAHCRFYTKGQTYPVGRFWKSLKWTSIPLSVGFAYIGYQQLGHTLERKEHEKGTTSQKGEIKLAQEWQVKLYKALPLKGASRLWGYVNSLELPVWLRGPVYRTYIKAFGCDLDEAAVRDLEYYRNLGEFFRRRLRPGVRPIDYSHSLISPSDGKILHFGKITSGVVEQVKGVTYPLKGFLGPPTWLLGQSIGPSANSLGPNANNSRVRRSTALTAVDAKLDGDFENIIKVNPDNDLYHCVIYLAPGDYHGFHSPAEWDVSYRRHFPGALLSVNPRVARRVGRLFNLNERAVYIGHWPEGFFAMAAVGATNVGSIKVYHDRSLETNVRGTFNEGIFFDSDYADKELGGIPMKRGEEFGEFNLGSTVVLVFEAPKTFRFHVEDGQKIKYGEPIGCYKTLEH